MTAPELIISQPDKSDSGRLDGNWNSVTFDSSGPEPTTLSSYSQKCGFACFNPPWLQDFGTKKIFLLAFMLLSVVQGMVWSYFTATLSTVQKRFKISSEMTGIVMTGSEVSQMLLSIVVSYYGARAHRTRWMAFGVLLNAISCFAIAAGHFLYGSGEEALSLTEEYAWKDPRMFQIHQSSSAGVMTSPSTPAPTNPLFIKVKVALCERKVDELAQHHGGPEDISLAPMVLLFMALFVHGIGGLFLWTLGGPYLDDNSKRKSLPMLFGTTSSLRLIGPTFGFLLASASLKMYVNPILTPTVSPGDPRWIGAWWFGWVVIGILLLVFSFIIALFPRRLRRGSVVDYSIPYEPPQQHLPGITEIPRAVKALLKNKIIIVNNLAGIFFVFSAMSYWTYMPKYMETIFNQTAADASIISGVMGIVSQASGLMASGYLISKYQFSARQLAAWNTMTGFIHGLIILYFITLGCDSGEFSFGPPKDDGTYTLANPCNSSCHCETSKIFPVCHPETNTVFYSACHAGCDTYDEATKTLSNCACLPDPKATLVPGNCSKGCGSIFFTFLLVNALIKFVDSTGRIGGMLISYRCVKLEERELSIGIHIALLSAFAFIPAPIVFGRIIDSVCLVWGGGGGMHGQGNCMLYNGKELRYLFNAFAAVLIFICVFFDWCVWYYVKDLDLYKEPENEKCPYEKEQLLPKHE